VQHYGFLTLAAKHIDVQIKLYEDDEGVRRKEIESLGGNNQFSTFYERLKEIKEYNRRHPTTEVAQNPDEEAIINSQVLPLSVMFSTMVPAEQLFSKCPT
jgi:hypothetical protein